MIILEKIIRKQKQKKNMRRNIVAINNVLKKIKKLNSQSTQYKKKIDKYNFEK
jgi:hypothetical protein